MILPTLDADYIAFFFFYLLRRRLKFRRFGAGSEYPSMAAIAVLFHFLFLFNLGVIEAQSQPQPPPPPPSDACNGIFLSYTYSTGKAVPPILKSDPSRQAYRFESAFSIVNNDRDELKSWRVFVGFQHDEYLVSASNAVLADGTSIPGGVGNGSVFAGYPNPDLKTGIETAGDLTQMSVQVKLVGTQFGVAPPQSPMPANISLANDGWVCPKPAMKGNSTMEVCCIRDPKFKTNVTTGDEFLPRQQGDLTIMYDVTRTYESNYWAHVTIENHNPLGRLDNWQLSWDWMEDEFIFAMKGAYPSLVDTSACVLGKQGQFYQDLDFSTALSCERRPTIIDLPLAKTNDTNLGMIPFCCRNGTILPPAMDPAKSKSAFQINVFKMPPNLNRSILSPPQNWGIKGRLNPDYKCGPPVRVSPSQFPDPSALLPDTAAMASWQVVCNITQPKDASPRCCVSFSAYYNESIIPCPTCACGCPDNTARTCSTSSPALFLPSQALLIPFENRTTLATAWADIHHFPVPRPLPCSDNCGVSINWHLFTDYRGGWSARITIFNWDDVPFVDWFTAVQLDKTAPGFEAVYSFNGTSLAGVNNTIFMQGLEGLNYLVGKTEGPNPQKDPRVPGKQQSVISFTKKTTPAVNIPNGDGFPTKVYFNGEECSLPKVLPTSGSQRFAALSWSVFLPSVVLLALVFIFLEQ
ncbi:COBRA-like protein 7 [Andrographis paniculata]|uniref:COBRA-like protein 7 n=1 Tax=Andrographis paniculata TaxID=175694 RepID=UPI0021E729EE|nr:COBRA-like protein 7 [Andrographis paniculata]